MEKIKNIIIMKYKIKYKTFFIFFFFIFNNNNYLNTLNKFKIRII